MFDQLPKEIKLHMFSFLGHREIGRLAQVSKEMKKLADDNQIWSQLLNVNLKEPSESSLKKIYLRYREIFKLPHNNYIAQLQKKKFDLSKFDKLFIGRYQAAENSQTFISFDYFFKPSISYIDLTDSWQTRNPSQQEFTMDAASIGYNHIATFVEHKILPLKKDILLDVKNHGMPNFFAEIVKSFCVVISVDQIDRILEVDKLFKTLSHLDTSDITHKNHFPSVIIIATKNCFNDFIKIKNDIEMSIATIIENDFDPNLFYRKPYYLNTVEIKLVEIIDKLITFTNQLTLENTKQKMKDSSRKNHCRIS